MFKKLREFKIVPFMEAENEYAALKAAEALVEAEHPVMEISMKNHNDVKALKAVSDEFPEFWLGAEGVLKKELLIRAIGAGAHFATAPGVNAETVREAAQKEFPLAPGVCTPSDIDNALINGAGNMQFFPAESCGGLDLLQAISIPFQHLQIEFFIKGGVNSENMQKYFSFKNTAAVSADWIIPYKNEDLSDQKNIIIKNVREALDKL